MSDVIFDLPPTLEASYGSVHKLNNAGELVFCSDEIFSKFMDFSDFL